MRLLTLLCFVFITGCSFANAQSCMTIHGRAHYYAGDGQLRIWHIGTHHEFDPDRTTWPMVMKWIEAGVKPSDRKRWAALESKLDLYADFRVCPTELYRKGSVQEAKILSATHRRYVTVYPAHER